MNERINELRLEAGIGRLHEVPYMVAVNKEGEVIDSLEGLQKFAELIVRECVVALEVEIDTWKEMDPYQGSMKRKGATAIKQHFGVE